MVASLIIGSILLAIGITFLAWKKKVPGLIMTIGGGLTVFIGMLVLSIVSLDLWLNGPGEKITILDVTPVDGLEASESKITYNSDFAKIEIKQDYGEHPEDTLTGVTADGSKWSTSDKDGKEAIHMNVDGKNITATVQSKKNDDKNTTGKTDAGKAAEAVAALVDTGYSKGKDNYNHNYAIWYVEPAQCLVYYPAQLELSQVYEDNTAVFTDKKSKAKLKISLDENNFASMDEVEGFIANTEYNKVLASGTDWYSCETTGKSKTEFSLTGLGQQYAVNVSLTYENKYSFVFEELRSLIKCKFVEDGKWVSTAQAPGKKLPALEGVYKNGLKWKLISRVFGEQEYMMTYPDVFTKEYHGDDGAWYFTDPVTGAYIKTFKQEYGSSAEALAIDYRLNEYNMVDEDILRGIMDYEDEYFKEYHFITLRNANEYHAIMAVPREYADLYEGAAAEMSLSLPGDEDGSTFEMQDLYFPDYHCFVTAPIQFEFEERVDDDFYYHDSFNGQIMHINFSDISDEQGKGSIFDVFEIVAEDEEVEIHENVVKWHTPEGLFVGGQGNNMACLLDITTQDAERAYSKCWSRFNIRFEEVAKARTIVDEVKKEVQKQKVKDETANGKADNTLDPGVGDAPEPDVLDVGVGDGPEEPVPEEPKKDEKKPAIVATPVNHELPQDTSYISDKKKNVVLWYKDYEDYSYVATTADRWFSSESQGAYFSHTYKTLLLSYINVVLRYNEYDIKVKSDWVEKVAVPAVDGLLEERYYESVPPASSMLGEEITSVFETYCEVLGIEVPDYVANAMEPTVLNENESQVVSSEEASVTNAMVAGTWVPYNMPNGEIKYVINEAGDYYVYTYDEESDYGYYYIAGSVIYLQSEYNYGGSYDIWYYDAKNDGLYIKKSMMTLFRFMDFDTSLSYDNDNSYAGTESGGDSGAEGIYEEDEEEYYDPGVPLYEQIGDEFGVEDVSEYGYVEYGNCNFIWYDMNVDESSFGSGNVGNKLAELVNEFESLGLTCDGIYSVQANYREEIIATYEPYHYAIEYSGVIEGYESLGTCYAVIVNNAAADNVYVAWMFENYESVPMQPGEGYVTKDFVRMINSYFLGKPADSPLDAQTVWYVSMIAGSMFSSTRPWIDNNAMDYYLIMESDDYNNPQWFGVNICEKDSNGELKTVTRTRKFNENGYWQFTYLQNGEWVAPY